MKSRMLTRWLIILTCFISAVTVLCCTAAIKPPKMTDEEVLRRRVEEYWSYKIKGQWDKAYVYESPDYQRRVALVAYVMRNGRSIVKWEGFNIVEALTSGEEGYAKVDRKYRYLIPESKRAAFNRVVEEKWVKKDGEWYRLSSPM